MLKTEPIGWNDITKEGVEKVDEACKNTVSTTAAEGMRTFENDKNIRTELHFFGIVTNFIEYIFLYTGEQKWPKTLVSPFMWMLVIIIINCPRSHSKRLYHHSAFFFSILPHFKPHHMHGIYEHAVQMYRFNDGGKKHSSRNSSNIISKVEKYF